MLISESITKIRRLVNDDSSEVFEDSHILKLFGREQQRFCRETLCLIKAISLMAPPELDYAFNFAWEDGFLEGRRFSPFFNNSNYSCSQPFEQTEDYDLSGDEYTITSGVDLLSTDPQHPVPFFFPEDFYSPKGIIWDYKWVIQESFKDVDRYYLDGWNNRGNVVDFFCHAKGLRQKAFYLKNMPYEVQASGTDQASMVDAEILENVLYVFYVVVPERKQSVSNVIEVQENFVKYVEYKVASRLLKSDTEIRDEIKAKHYDLRFQIGVNLTKKVTGRLMSGMIHRFGEAGYSIGTKPSYPRLPDHYPKLGVR